MEHKLLDGYTVLQLKAKAKKFDLSDTGDKAALIDTIMTHIERQGLRNTPLTLTDENILGQEQQQEMDDAEDNSTRQETRPQERQTEGRSGEGDVRRLAARCSVKNAGSNDSSSYGTDGAIAATNSSFTASAFDCQRR